MEYKFYIIYEWMAKDLNLSISEQLVFAFLFNICKNNERCFPSQDYISQMTGLSKRTVIRTIIKLIDKNLIEKERGAFNSYTITDKVKDIACKNGTL